MGELQLPALKHSSVITAAMVDGVRPTLVKRQVGGRASKTLPKFDPSRHFVYAPTYAPASRNAGHMLLRNMDTSGFHETLQVLETLVNHCNRTFVDGRFVPAHKRATDNELPELDAYDPIAATQAVGTVPIFNLDSELTSWPPSCSRPIRRPLARLRRLTSTSS